MAGWAQRFGLSRQTLIVSVRTAIASTASLLLARSFKLPEFYWAPISTIVVLLSTINPLRLAWQRFVGTAIGVTVGAGIASLPHHNWFIYGLGIFFCGILSSAFRVAVAFRFAAIGLSIVLLIANNRPPWTVAMDRFTEVSLGIAVALLVTVAWPVSQGQVR